MNPLAARPIRSLAILALAASMAACATVDPDAPPDVPEGAEQATRTESNGDVVTDYEGTGAHARVQVNFDGAGSKWLVLAYANLQPA